MSFPLLRLPLVASTNVVNSIDVGDFVNLIRTSTRMRNLVKYSRVSIELTVNGDFSVKFKKLSDPNKTKLVPFFVKRLSIEDQGIISFKPFVRQRPSMWETDLEGYRRMMDDFISIFRVKSVDFDLRATHPDISIQYLEYAMKFGLKFKKVQVSVDEDNLDDNRRVLCACTQASEVYVTSYEYPESFKFEGFHEYAMDHFELKMYDYLEWFTVDNLCALVNCSNIRIYSVKLSDADFNKFLKHWMAGAGKMKTLVVHLDCPDDQLEYVSINPQTVMNGIPNKEIESNDGYKFEIERSDGVKAYVTCSGLTFTIEDSEFSF